MKRVVFLNLIEDSKNSAELVEGGPWVEGKRN